MPPPLSDNRGSLGHNVFLRNFGICWVFLNFFGQILKFWVEKTLFLSFSKQNHAESSRNLIKNSVLHPKCAKLNQRSWFGHVRTWKVVIWSCPDLKSRDLDMSGPEKSWFGHVRTCPRGQVLTSNHRKYFYFFRFYKYLLQTIGNTFIFSDFTPFHFLLANLSFFYKIICFL